MKIIRSLSFSILCIVLIASFSSVPLITPQLASASDKIKASVDLMLNDKYRYDPNLVLVSYKDHPDKVKVMKLGTFTAGSGKSQAQVDQTSKDKLRQQLTSLLSDPNVAYAQPQYYYTTSAWTRIGSSDYPDDFANVPYPSPTPTPNPATGNNWYYQLSNLPKLWKDQDCANGGSGCGGNSNVIVAVIDTGLAYENRTSAYGDVFVKNDDMFTGPASIHLYNNSGELPAPKDTNQIDDDANGYIDDAHGLNTGEYVWCTFESTCNAAQTAEMGHMNDDIGHGTYVTGMITSLVGNTFGSVSAAHNVTIMPIKANIPGSASFGTLELTTAIDYAVNHGAKVINMSLAGPAPDSALETKLQWAADQGVTVLAASGNANTDVYYPAAYDSVIAVGAVTAAGVRTNYSNFGTALDISAYVGNGGGVGDWTWQRTYSCFFAGNCGTALNPFSTFATGGGIGTSFASPQAAALAALMISVAPNITQAGIEHYMYTDAIQLGTPGGDIDTGWGAIDFQKTVADVRTKTAPSITLVQPDASVHNVNGGFNITWTDSDPDGTALENFFYDTNNTGLDGVAIPGCSSLASSTPNTCFFDTRSVPAGSYYIYGCIDDNVNPQTCSYSPGALTVTHPILRDSGTITATTTFQTVNFATVFDTAPIVLAKVSSKNGTDTIHAEVKNVTATSFQVAIIENTALGYDNIHRPETVSWYAVQSSNSEEQAGALPLNDTWQTITFPVAFASPPKVFAVKQTQNDTDISTVRIRNVSATSFDARVEAEPGFSGPFVNETVGWDASLTNSAGQEGTFTANSTWATFTFPSAFAGTPTLITGLDTDNEADQAQADIRNLTATGFDYRVEEDPVALNGTHGNETFAWFAIPSATPNHQKGSLLVNTSYISVNFPSAFSVTPVVIASITSTNGTDLVQVNVKDVTTTGFKVEILEDTKAGYDDLHRDETVSWYAVAQSSGTEQVGTRLANHVWQTVTFTTPFASPPQVLGGMQTHNGIDVADIDIRNVTTTGFDVRVEEDARLYDGLHCNETIGYIAYDTSNQGEAGTMQSNSSWSTLTFTAPFATVPKLVAVRQTKNGTDTVHMRIRNLTTTGAEVLMQEQPRYYDGIHRYETVAWYAEQ